jgi:hypothetical protein
MIAFTPRSLRNTHHTFVTYDQDWEHALTLILRNPPSRTPIPSENICGDGHNQRRRAPVMARIPSGKLFDGVLVHFPRDILVSLA